MKINLLLILLLIFILISHGYSQDRQGSVIDNLSEANKRHLQQLVEEQERRDARILNYLTNHPPKQRRIVYEDGTIIEIRDIIDGKPIYIATSNQDAGFATRTNTLQPGGSLGLNLDGSGMTVGVWDGGPVQLNHPEFLDITNSIQRVTNIDNSIVDGDTNSSSHGTHVTGTIAAKGVNASAKGMAPNVFIKSYNWTNDYAEMLLAINNTTNPIMLSNHSYGVPVNQENGTLDAWFMGAYNTDAANLDQLIRNNPHYLMVTSAGNAGNISYAGGLYSGFDKLTTDKNSKNNLVVANANPTLAPFTNDLTSLTINNGSSQGPTDDLRIKPDIAADGTQVFSTVPTNGYTTFSGTSMAAPNVTGTLVLLQQYYQQLYSRYMLASTLKGLVCHTSRDDVARPGPDPVFGWGFLDAYKATNAITDTTTGNALIQELSLNNNETYSYIFSAEAGYVLSATLCWTDMPGAAVSNQLNNTTPRLVNDLDLRLTKDGVDYLPYRLVYSETTGFTTVKGDNHVDNIERIDIVAPESGDYTLTVSHKGTLQGNVGGPFDPQRQDFSLILTGNNLTLSTATFNFENVLIWPNPAKDYINIKLNTEVINDCSVFLYDTQVRLVKQENLNSNSIRGNFTLNATGLSNGMYLLRLTSDGKVHQQKIVINN